MNPVTIIKIGGAVLEADLAPLWKGVAERRRTEAVALVHGGGPQSTALARRLGHEPAMMNGRRITTDLDLEITKMTVGGVLNVDLTAGAVAAGLPAIGLSGVSGGTVSVVRRPPWTVDNRPVDFGHVGDVVAIETGLLHALFQAAQFPVIACMGIDATGGVYNVNADTVAAEIAAAFFARRLFLVTESGGIRDRSGSLIQEMTGAEALSGIAAGWIENGMIVKVHTAISALERGVNEVRIIDQDGVANAPSGTRIVE